MPTPAQKYQYSNLVIAWGPSKNKSGPSLLMVYDVLGPVPPQGRHSGKKEHNRDGHGRGHGGSIYLATRTNY